MDIRGAAEGEDEGSRRCLIARQETPPRWNHLDSLTAIRSQQHLFKETTFPTGKVGIHHEEEERVGP